ncbi:MAG: hypothetical protein ABUS51_06130 [Acidobacteriota bacterium]
MKLTLTLSLCLLSGLSLSVARAQVNADVSFGVGTTSVSSSGQSINTFGNGTLYNTPSMTGAFGKISGDLILKRGFGIGAEYSFRFSQGPYAGLNYRPSFYDVNAVYSPVLHSKRIQPEFQGGLGGMRLSYFQNVSACDSFAGCSSTNNFVESSNHFQLHGLAAVRVYLTPKIFVRPEVDVHWVNNLFQFGSNFVPQYGVSLGYSFGRE